MLESLISRHIVNLGMILIFSMMLRFRKSLRDLEAKYFWLTVISCLLLAFEDVLEIRASEDPSLRFWRILLSVLGYTWRSTAILGLLLVIAPREKRNFLLWIPSLLTLLASGTAFFTDIAFGFDDEYAFYRGPLGYVAFAVPIFYLLLILWIVFRNYTQRNSAGRYILPACGFLCLAASVADARLDGVRLNEAIIFSSVFFYITLYSHDNRRDPLTGLLNRKAFYDDCGSQGKGVRAVASLDMNGLKTLNDTQGHEAGDKALVVIGGCIGEVMNQQTLAYRIGGDEFILLFFHDDEQKICRVEEQIREKVSGNGYSVSIGHAIRQSGENLDDTIRASDRLMYDNKAEYYRRNGRDRRRRGT